MKQKIAFIFPGQGEQCIGMAREFYDHFAVSKECFEEAADVLGWSVADLVFNSTQEELTKTSNCQVGIFVASMAILAAVQQQFPELKPVMTAGLSLGEYSALVAAGKLDFATCLKLVDQRARSMHKACDSTEGSLAAVMEVGAEVVESTVAQLNRSDLWIANYNCPGQTVISGTPEGLAAGMEALKEAGARRVLPLTVHGAFHSGLMQPAANALTPHIQAATFSDTDIDLYMNVPGALTKESEEIQENLIAQVTGSVRWEQSIRAMDAAGATLFIEMGPGKSLANLNKRNGVNAPTISINALSGLETLAEALDQTPAMEER